MRPGRARPTAAAALALSGRYAWPGRQAAAALTAWADARGVALRLEDDRSDPAESARLARALAGRDLLFGPYGSGPARAAARALAGTSRVLFNHGGAATEGVAARVVDVIGPAGRYWAGLAEVLRAGGAPLGAVAVLHAPTGFGRATAHGAVEALGAAGARPLHMAELTERDAGSAAAAALAAGARVVVGCGRIEDDLALGRVLAGRCEHVALVVCGVARAHDELGDAVEGWIGPAQWLPGGARPPVPLPAGADYPAAQALHAALIAETALARAGSAAPDALWAAALGLRTRTFLGAYAVDARGRQRAHAPLLVRWRRGPGGLAREVAWRPPAPLLTD